jgi:hypothetical protein
MDEPISSSSRERFLRNSFPTASTTQVALTLISFLLSFLPYRATFTCHYPGVSHAEWPKANHEYAPPQIGEAIY